MLELLQDIALGKITVTSIQLRAAMAAVQYTHAKKGDGGKKDAAKEAAAKASTGRFSSIAPPRSRMN